MQITRVLVIAATVLLANPPFGRACTTDTDCNDGNGCNGADTCQAGTCYPGYPQNCGSIPNFVAWCDPLTGCNYQLSRAFVGCDAPNSAALAFATPCSQEGDCPPRHRCSVKSSAEVCIARGGSPGGGSCCDATCGLP
jgi:hypothetical protein